MAVIHDIIFQVILFFWLIENYNKVVGELYFIFMVQYNVHAYFLHVDILSRLKIVCLEKNRDEARKKYRSHKTDYVNNCLGRPLDKLNVNSLTAYYNLYE